MLSENIVNQLNGERSRYCVLDGHRFWIDSKGSVYQCMPLRWRVLADEGDTLLLLQDYILESCRWDKEVSDTSLMTWEHSDLREYLNSDTFLDKYFTEEEKNDILVSTVTNTAVGQSFVPVSETYDRIYVPSIEEIENWFPEQSNRRAHYYSFRVPEITTPMSGFVGNANAYNYDEYTCAYWTRTPNNLNYGMLRPAVVGSEGIVGNYSHVYNTWSMGIRPVIRISKDSINYYKSSNDIQLCYDSDKEFLETYPTESYKIPVKITGGSDKEQAGALIVGTIENNMGESGTLRSVNDDLTVNVSVGSYLLTCSLYGINPEPITAKIVLNVKPPIENITVQADPDNDALEILWSNQSPSPGYEISRSTSETGEYTVIYSGTVDGLKDQNTSMIYVDRDIEKGHKYWYKVRGLIAVEGEYVSSYNGMEAEYSTPVCGELPENSEKESNVLEKIPDAVLYVPYEYDCSVIKVRNGMEKEVYNVITGNLPTGLNMDLSGKIYGISKETGEFTFTVDYGGQQKTYALKVLDNISVNAESCTDAGYEIIQRVPDFSADSISDQTIVSVGEYNEFQDVYIDGVRLAAERDYISEAGSTRVTIRSETFARFNQPGQHTIVIEFRTTVDNSLKRAVQNYYVYDAGDTSYEDKNVADSSNATDEIDITENEDIDGISNDMLSVNGDSYYIVVKGDTLSAIAVRFGITLSKLLSWNPQIKNPNLIYPGQVIVVGRTVADLVNGEAGGVFAVVQKGDCLYKIARRNGVSLKTVLNLNPEIAKQKYIYAGQKVRVK